MCDLCRTQLKNHRASDDTTVVSFRIPVAIWERLEHARTNNRTPRPHDTVGAYVKWFLSTQFLRKR